MSSVDEKVTVLLDSLSNTSENFQGGKLALFYDKWAFLTDNSEILDTVDGLRINVQGNLPLLALFKGFSILRKGLFS